MEHRLIAYQCSECKVEFVVLNLNKAQYKKDDSDPFCPECGQDDPVNPIECVDLRLTENAQPYHMTKSTRALED